LTMVSEAFGDDGYGGRRVGLTTELGWQWRRDLAVTGRGGVVDVVSDSARGSGTSATAAATAGWQLDDGIAVLATIDVAHAALLPVSIRTLAVLDLSFEPDP
jgi:hypothetical protein